MRMHFLLRLLINAAALWVATHFVSGLAYTGSGISLFLVALVFGVLNASVRPLLKLLTFPILILLRRRLSPVGFWVGIIVSVGVAVIGLYWVVERLLNA